MIPKIIHYCWLSGDPYPELIEKCIHSWGFTCQIISSSFGIEKKADSINNEWLRQTIGANKYAFATDYIRIYALSHYGGVYLDTDVELVAPLDSFLSHDFFIGFEYNYDLEPAVFGAIADHPRLTDLLKYYRNRSFIKKDGTLDMRPLPTIFNETATARFGFKRNGKLQFFNDEGIAIYPCDFFSPKNIYFKQIKRTDNTVSIHYFDGSWVKKNKKYTLKQILHQMLYRLGGKSFHSKIIQISRRIFQ